MRSIIKPFKTYEHIEIRKDNIQRHIENYKMYITRNMTEQKHNVYISLAIFHSIVEASPSGLRLAIELLFIIITYYYDYMVPLHNLIINMFHAPQGGHMSIIIMFIKARRQMRQEIIYWASSGAHIRTVQGPAA